MEDEENQIRGVVHIVDAAGVNLPYMTIFTPKEAARIVKNAEVYHLHDHSDWKRQIFYIMFLANPTNATQADNWP